jgi:replicative DNA helicase
MQANCVDTLLPVDSELEREILGCCFAEDTSSLTEVRSVIDVADFGTEEHRRVFRSLCRLADAGEPLTWTAVFADMQARHEPMSLGALTEYTGPPWALERMLRRAKDLAQRRELIFRGRDLMHQAGDLTLPLNEVTQRTIAALQEASGVPVDSTTEDVGGIVHRAGGVDAFLAPRVGIATPWRSFDGCTGGWQKGELALIAARPSMGKTAFALNAVYHSAKHGVPAAFYSYEMPAESILRRLISLLARITYKDLERGDLNAAERRAVSEVMAQLAALPLRIVQASGKTVLAIRCHAERLRRKGLLGIAAIDYVGLIRGSGTAQNRNQELGDICRQLKEMAGELDVPLLVLSQLNRAAEGRPDKRPNMADLRDSGELENHADLIGFLFRPGYYNRQDESLRLIAELAIAKQRNGDTPTMPLVFRREYGHFAEECERFS